MIGLRGSLEVRCHCECLLRVCLNLFVGLTCDPFLTSLLLSHSPLTEQVMLEAGDSPLLVSLQWRDPSEGAIWLQRLPAGALVGEGMGR